MYIWSKLSAACLLETWEDRFKHIPECHFIVSAVPTRSNITLEVYCPKEKEARAIQKQYGGAVKKLKEQNWVALAPPPPGPIKIRDRLVIVAESNKKELAKLRSLHSGRDLISVPADMAFGTGHHATTATILRFIVDLAEQWRSEGRQWNLLDLGCGSAILGIAARKLGASSVWGCDFDAHAIRVARENAVNNDTPDLTLEVADVLKWKPKERYELVVANIFSNILIAIFPKLVRSMKKDGVLMISGILHTQSEDCLAAGRAAGVEFDKIVRKGRWVSAQGHLKKK